MAGVGWTVYQIAQMQARNDIPLVFPTGTSTGPQNPILASKASAMRL